MKITIRDGDTETRIHYTPPQPQDMKLKTILLLPDQQRKCNELAGFTDEGPLRPERHTIVGMDWPTFHERGEVDDCCWFNGRLVAKWIDDDCERVYLDITDPDNPTYYTHHE